MIKTIFYLVSILLINLPLFATELPMEIALLRGLDKVTGRISTFSIPVGEVGRFGRTFVSVEACYTRPPEESPEDSAFLYVFEKSEKDENIELFKGWMFSSNPALSSMEHPVYDVWVLDCLPADKNNATVFPRKTKELESVKSFDLSEEKLDNPENVEKPEKIKEPLDLVPSGVVIEEI